MAEHRRQNEDRRGRSSRPSPGDDGGGGALGYAEAIIATVREPLVVLDGDLRVRTANRSFYRTFRVVPEETEGRLLYDLGNRQWDIPALRKLLGEILPRDSEFNDFEVQHEFPSIGRKVMLLNARKVHREGDHAELILLAVEDVTALREADRARREAETRFTEMVRNVRDHSIFLTDPDGVITSWNVAAERIIGYPEAEALGKHFSLIFTPEDVAAGVPGDELRQARDEGRAEDERWHRRKDGTLFWALGIVTPRRDPAGRLTGFSKVLRDMTDRKRADEELGAGRRRLQALFDNSLDAILLADDQARYVEANPAACALLGYDRAELLRRGVFDVTPVPNGEAGRAAWAAFVRDGRQAGEYALRRKDGTTALVEYRAVANVQPGVHLSALRDVTERKRSVDALRVSERRFKTLAGSAPVGIFETDPAGHCLFVNDRWCAMAGMTPDQAGGAGWAGALHPEDRDRVVREWYAAAGQGREFAGEYRFRTPQGRVTWLAGSAVALRDEGGAITGYIGTVTDITGLKEAEERARRRAEEVERLMEVIPVAVWLARDRDCRHVLGNRAGSAMLRMPEGANLSKTAAEGEQPTHFRVFQDGRELPPEQLPLQQAAARGVEVHGVEEDIVFADGAAIQVYGSAAPLFDEAGAVRGAVACFQDVSALRRAEASRRESDARLRTIIDNCPSAIFVKDPAGRYLLANRACEAYAGGPAEAAVGRTAAAFFPPDVAARLGAEDRRVLEAGEVLRYEAEMPVPGGTRTALTVKFPLRDAAGAVYAVCGVATDITELRRTADALRASEARLRAMADAWPSIIFIKDRDGRYLMANQACRAYSNASPEAMIGKTDFDLLPREYAERFRADDLRILRSGTPERYEEEAPIDGRPTAFLTVKFPLRDAAGDVYAVCGIATDITDLKRAERERRASRERLDLVVDAAGVGLWYCDLPFDKLVWNAKVKEHFGLPADAAVTIDTFYQCLHPADRDRTRRAIENSVREGTPYDIEYRTAGPDGRERWVRAIGRPFYDPAGEPARFDGITLDVTERVRQEQALREADRRKDEFLATLAHELRNPLAPIRNALHVMKLAGGDAAVVEPVRAMMDRQVGTMARLLDDLLDVSRITRGKLELRKERVELATVVRSAVEGSRPLVEAAAHRLAVSLPPEPVWLDADPVRLAQVFANLLTNAAKYTDRGGDIRLTAGRDGGEVVVAVRDTGIGIAPEHLPRLFEMFSQVASALERSQGGLGIGLSLVKGLVEMHGGAVGARSEGLGKGSEFVVRLPVRDGPPAPSAEHPVGETATARPRRRVLVADDNRDAADSLAIMLRLAGHEVHAVHDGQEAVEAAGRFRPDVALLDLGMPRLNGFEAARHIRGQPWGRRVVLVAITGWGQEEDRRRATEAGFDHHLTKPVEPAALDRVLSGSKTA